MSAHGALMDSVYRGQRHIYDVTRKYYLFGRDRLIDDLNLAAGGSVLEIGCGTGRNLALIRRRWPEADLFGLDISAAMLESALRKLGADAQLALGDATCFDPAGLFGRTTFDRIVFSYTLSMIPDWPAALAQASALVADHGSLHAVDFGTMRGLPTSARAVLRAWLGHFHVAPRDELVARATALASRENMIVRARAGLGDYYVSLDLRRAPRT